MNKLFKMSIITTMALFTGLSTIIPEKSVSASTTESNTTVSLWDIEDGNNIRYDEKETHPEVKLTTDELIIQGKSYTASQLIALLETSTEINGTSSNGRQKRFAPAAAIYFIPGVGQVALAATGVIAIGGVTIGAGHWAYQTIKKYFAKKGKKTAKKKKSVKNTPAKLYNTAKKKGIKVKNRHTTIKVTKKNRSLPSRVSKSYSSKDLIKNGKLDIRRYYGKNGKAEVDIHYTNHGNAKKHPKVPHRHGWHNVNGKWTKKNTWY